MHIFTINITYMLRGFGSRANKLFWVTTRKHKNGTALTFSAIHRHPGRVMATIWHLLIIVLVLLKYLLLPANKLVFQNMSFLQTFLFLKNQDT